MREKSVLGANVLVKGFSSVLTFKDFTYYTKVYMMGRATRSMNYVE